MAALQTLQDGLADQTAAINELAAAISNIPPNGGAGGATEQQVESVAAQVIANNTAIRAQLTLMPSIPKPTT